MPFNRIVDSLKRDLSKHKRVKYNGCTYVDESKNEEEQGRLVKCMECFSFQHLNPKLHGCTTGRTKPWEVSIIKTRKSSIITYYVSNLIIHDQSTYHQFIANRSPSKNNIHNFEWKSCNGILPHCDIMNDQIQHGLKLWMEQLRMVNGSELAQFSNEQDMNEHCVKIS